MTSGASARISATASVDLIRFGCRIGRLLPAASILIGGASIRCWRSSSGAEADRRCGHFLFTTDRFIRLCDAAENGVFFGIEKRAQCRHSDCARADEDDAHCALASRRSQGHTARTPLRHSLRHHFLAGCNFTLADGRGATGAKIIEDFLVGED